MSCTETHANPPTIIRRHLLSPQFKASILICSLCRQVRDPQKLARFAWEGAHPPPAPSPLLIFMSDTPLIEFLYPPLHITYILARPLCSNCAHVADLVNELFIVLFLCLEALSILGSQVSSHHLCIRKTQIVYFNLRSILYCMVNITPHARVNTHR